MSQLESLAAEVSDMAGDYQHDLDSKRSRRRVASTAATRGAGSSRTWSSAGCSLLSLALTALIIALASTGLLEQSVSLIKDGLQGGASARSKYRLQNNCRQLVLTLKLYAADHDGDYPASLHDLAPSQLSEAELGRLLTEGSEGSATGAAWLLTPHLTSSSSATDILILSASPSGDRKRIAGLNDGSVISISEDQAAGHLLLHDPR